MVKVSLREIAKGIIGKRRANSDFVNGEKKPASYWAAAFKRFRQNKMAVISAVFVILLLIVGFFAPIVAPFPYDEPHYESAFQASSKQFIMGTDDLGRDLYSRLIFSLRNALLIAFGAQAVSLAIGVILGAVAGFRGGWIDTAIMRVVDIMFAFPTFLFNIILITVMGRGLFTIFIAIGITSWAGTARLMRGQIMFLRNAEFVEAARAIGAKDGHIIRKYLLPNTLGPIIVSVVFGIPGAIWQESGLALIGMGLNPPMPSWGNLMGSGIQMVMGYPYLLFWPAVTFAFTLLAITFLGDGLQDALNPRSET